MALETGIGSPKDTTIFEKGADLTHAFSCNWTQGVVALRPVVQWDYYSDCLMPIIQPEQKLFCLLMELNNWRAEHPTAVDRVLHWRHINVSNRRQSYRCSTVCYSNDIKGLAQWTHHKWSAMRKAVLCYGFIMRREWWLRCIIYTSTQYDTILILATQPHDDVIKWKHFPHYWPFVRGIHRFPVNSPHKGQWRGALMFSLIWARTNGWVNKGEASDLRCHRAHYDVIVMLTTQWTVKK